MNSYVYERASGTAPMDATEHASKALPYPHQISDIDLSQPDVLRFSWRDGRYRVSQNLNVDSIQGPVLVGDDASILMRRVLQLCAHPGIPA